MAKQKKQQEISLAEDSAVEDSVADETTATSNVDFEKSLEELEAIVERMEGGDLSLEDSLAEFQKGITLTRSCQKALDDAELKVKVLLEENGESKAVAFDKD